MSEQKKLMQAVADRYNLDDSSTDASIRSDALFNTFLQRITTEIASLKSGTFSPLSCSPRIARSDVEPVSIHGGHVLGLHKKWQRNGDLGDHDLQQLCPHGD